MTGFSGQAHGRAVAQSSLDAHHSLVPSNTPRQSSARWLPSVLPWAAIVVAGIGLGLLAKPPRLPGEAVTGRVFARVPAPPPDLGTLLYFLGVGSFVWYAATLSLPLLVWGARHVESEGRHRLRTATTASITVLGLFFVSSLLQYMIDYNAAPSRPGFGAYIPLALRQYLLPWVAIVGIAAAVEGRRRANRASIERERLRAQVAEQRLIALTGQLQPHFLFNTLQGISTLIHRDPEAADEMLAKLSDLLRDLLRHRDHVLVQLGDELRFTQTYLEIAQLRFSDRLTFEIHSGEALRQAAVPLFILQPLVENALAHGIGARARGGRIDVSASAIGDRIRLTVADDGAGLQNGASREGLGVSNTRQRLRASFGDDHSFVFENGPGGGLRAMVEIPLRILPDEAP